MPKFRERRFEAAGFGGGQHLVRVIECPLKDKPEGAEPVTDETPVSDWQPETPEKES